MKRGISVLGMAALLAGCAYGPEPTIHGVRDISTGQVVSGLAVLSTGDPGSGPIQSLVLQQRYQRGPFDVISSASGPGTVQTFSEGALGGLFIGAGTAGAGALIPASKTIISNVGNSRSRSAGGAGGNASATGGTSAASARGGNASLNANLSNRQRQLQTQHQNATATSDAAASTGPVSSSSTSGGGIIPNGTTLHTPGGDIVVDPTVRVSQ